MKRIFLAISILYFAHAVHAAAWVDIEGGAVFTGYNNVQIPSETGTRFSLKDDISQNRTGFYRIQAGYAFDKRHNVFALYAPLTVKGKSRIDKDISYQGKTFSAGSTVSSEYRFDSYRVSYVYTFYETKTLLLGAGITGKIRDAEITLSDSSGKASRKNTGFVPLIHLSAEWFFVEQASLRLDGDGLAAPQGRAEDFLLSLNYSVHTNLSFKAGYRVLEGGSDGGGSVYTFALFHYAVAGAQYRF